ncbi:MAG TPA: exodeoxyribonuclease VII large subunit [Candidatus Methanoperedenaceae archaeon]|nr:exodeoxyribonuclease VII large subunit [Candidatus Methanoperedenaceae archaeon]
MDEKGVYTVSELTGYIRGALTSDPGLSRLWVRGEISNLTNHSSGHRFFTVKDEKSQLPCVMFRSNSRRLRFELEAGMKVILFGDIDVFERDGRYQFMVTDVRPDGTGELYKAFEQRKAKLAAEGLFDPEHKRKLPGFPSKIGVVTSPTGAVIRDILNIVRRRFPVHIVVAPAIVQGEFAKDSIVRSIGMLNRTDVNVIILARGGGSLEDLWAFNEEAVVRAVYDSRIPVISAVGHETDYTLADFAADCRAPTPSAAAELVVPDGEQVASQLSSTRLRLASGMKHCIRNNELDLVQLSRAVEPGNLLAMIKKNRERLSRDRFACHKCMRSKLVLLRTGFNARTGRLDAVSPIGTLRRGYSISLRMPEKSLISRCADAGEGDKIEIIVQDGKIRCDVRETGTETPWKN